MASDIPNTRGVSADLLDINWTGKMHPYSCGISGSRRREVEFSEKHDFCATQTGKTDINGSVTFNRARAKYAA